MQFPTQDPSPKYITTIKAVYIIISPVYMRLDIYCITLGTSVYVCSCSCLIYFSFKYGVLNFVDIFGRSLFFVFTCSVRNIQPYTRRLRKVYVMF